MDPHPPRRTRSRRAALLLLPLVLALAGCFRMDLAVDINADETVGIAMDFADKSGTLTAEDLDCADLQSQMDLGSSEGVEVTAEQTEEDGNVGCRLTATGGSIDEMTGEGMSVTHEGDLYVFALEAGEEAVGDLGDLPAGMEPEVSVAVTFPGAVVDAGGGEVDGSTVTWTGLEAVSSGVRATGQDEGSAVAAAAGSPVLWIVLGILALLLLAAVVFVLTRRAKAPGTEGPEDTGVSAAAGHGYPAPGGYGGPYGDAPQGYPGAGGGPVSPAHPVSGSDEHVPTLADLAAPGERSDADGAADAEQPPVIPPADSAADVEDPRPDGSMR